MIFIYNSQDFLETKNDLLWAFCQCSNFIPLCNFKINIIVNSDRCTNYNFIAFIKKTDVSHVLYFVTEYAI